MNDIQTTNHNLNEVAKPFRPEYAIIMDAKADAVIAYAKKVRDWPALEAAINTKIQDQQEFVQWWDKNVLRKGGTFETNTNSAERRYSTTDAEAISGVSHQQVSKWRRRLQEPEKYRAMLYGVTYHKAMCEISDTTAMKWTGDPESYTPEKYIVSVRTVMCAIDLDPASNAIAQKTVQAGEWYDETKNGLLQKWHGRVFLNPPYSFPTIWHFVKKLCSEYDLGHVETAILLTNNNTDTQWWHTAAKKSCAVCFTSGRINFYKADGSITQPTNGQTFFYFGKEITRFLKEFSKHGLVMDVLYAP